MKLPAKYSRKVLSTLGEHSSSHPPGEVVDRILTPPYLSNIPDVYYHRIRKSRRDPVMDVALVLCSDGLTELYDDQEDKETLLRWARIVGPHARRCCDRPNGGNVALRLLRDAIGGTDIHKVSRNLTVEMEERWMDDTTILVQHLL